MSERGDKDPLFYKIVEVNFFASIAKWKDLSHVIGVVNCIAIFVYNGT
jgi:hypothetical protein